MRRERQRVAGVLTLVLMVIGCTAPKTTPRAPAAQPILVSHHDIGKNVVQEIRLHEGRDVWAVVSDANTLIYDYSLVGRPLTIDTVVRNAVRTLLGAPRTVGAVKPPTQPTGPSGRVAALPRPDSLLHFAAFADSVLRSARAIASFVRYSDEERYTDSVRHRLRTTLESLEVQKYLVAEGQLQAHVDMLWRGTTPASQQSVAVTKTMLDSIVPRLVQLDHAVRRATFGPVSVLRQFDGGEGMLVELNVSSKLEPAYPGVRWKGEGKDIAVVRPAFRWIEWTAGMAGVLRSGRSFHLQQQLGDSAKFKVTRSRDARLGIVPVGMLTVQGPCCRRGVIGGISAGVGIRNGALRQLDQSSDILLMGTLGLDWLRVSLGPVYTAEVYEIEGVQAGDIVDDPNALNNERVKRRIRLGSAFHIRF